jgi:hypothetical protein
VDRVALVQQQLGQVGAVLPGDTSDECRLHCGQGYRQNVLSDSLVYVAGHRGLVGSAVWRALQEREVETVGWSSADLDLRDRDATFDAVLSARPQVLVMAAARVGGIMANATHPVDFLNDNLRIQTNLFEGGACRRRGAGGLPGVQLHLPEVRTAADPGVGAAHRPPGIQQRGPMPLPRSPESRR